MIAESPSPKLDHTGRLALPVGQSADPHPSGGRGLSERITLGAYVILVGLALMGFAYFAQIFLVPLLFAWVISMALQPPMNWLRGWHVPAAVAAFVIVSVFFGILGAGAINLGRPAVEWLKAAPEQLPRLKEKFHGVLSPAAKLSQAAATVGNLDGDRQLPAVEVKDHRLFNTVFTWTGSLMTGIGETMALTFLFLATGEKFIQKLGRIARRFHEKKRVIEIGREIQHSVSLYLFSVGLINVGVGVVVAIAFYIMGMPGAAMWGAIAAVLNFLPYFGPVLGVGLISIAGLLAFDTVGRGMLPAVLYSMIHLVEAYCVTPFALSSRFTMSPVVIFVSLMFGFWIWGVPGALLAVPLLVILKVFCDRLPSMSVVGELVSR